MQGHESTDKLHLGTRFLSEFYYNAGCDDEFKALCDVTQGMTAGIVASGSVVWIGFADDGISSSLLLVFEARCFKGVLTTIR